MGAEESYLYVCPRCGPRLAWHVGRPSRVTCGCGRMCRRYELSEQDRMALLKERKTIRDVKYEKEAK